MTETAALPEGMSLKEFRAVFDRLIRIAQRVRRKSLKALSVEDLVEVQDALARTDRLLEQLSHLPRWRELELERLHQRAAAVASGPVPGPDDLEGRSNLVGLLAQVLLSLVQVTLGIMLGELGYDDLITAGTREGVELLPGLLSALLPMATGAMQAAGDLYELHQAGGLPPPNLPGVIRRRREVRPVGWQPPSPYSPGISQITRPAPRSDQASRRDNRDIGIDREGRGGRTSG